MKIFLAGAAGKAGRAIWKAGTTDHEIIAGDIASDEVIPIAVGSFTDDDYLNQNLPGCDVASANLAAATATVDGFDVFNIGVDTPLTNHDIIQSRKDVDSVLEKYWPASTKVLLENNLEVNRKLFWPVARVEKAKTMLNWKPVYNFEWYLRNLGWDGS